MTAMPTVAQWERIVEMHRSGHAVFAIAAKVGVEVEGVRVALERAGRMAETESGPGDAANVPGPGQHLTGRR